MKKISIILFSIYLSVYITGCSIFADRTQQIMINGNPVGATVIVDGKNYIAPCTVTIDRDKNITMVVMKDGYLPQTMESNWELSTTGMLDLAGGWLLLLPGIGLFFPGAKIHKQTNHYYVLQKENVKVAKTDTVNTDK